MRTPLWSETLRAFHEVLLGHRRQHPGHGLLHHSIFARAASSASLGDTGRSASGAAVGPSPNDSPCTPPSLRGRCPASSVVRGAPPPTAARRSLGIPPSLPLLIARFFRCRMPEFLYPTLSTFTST